MNNFNEYRKELLKSLNQCIAEEWDIAKDLIFGCWKRNGVVYIIGNGGSAQTASHFEIDWNKGIFEKSKNTFVGRTVSLTNNYGLITAIGNDLGFDQVFVHQLKKNLEEKDLLVSITGSGNSQNIIESIIYAKQKGVTTLSFVGFDGGTVKKLSDFTVHVQTFDMQIVEDIHSIFGHYLLKAYLI